MTAETLRPRRRTNGTIDIDHYRELAQTERKAVMTTSLRGAFSRGWLLFAILALIAAGATVSPPTMEASSAGVTLASH